MEEGREIKVGSSRAFWSTFLGLPVVVARAHPFIPIKPRRHTQALVAALLTEEHAGLVILRLAAPPRALRWALETLQTPRSISVSVLVVSPMAMICQYQGLKHGNGKQSQQQESRELGDGHFCY